MKRYFKLQGETVPVVSYIEFEDGDPTRQVNIYEKEWAWASFEENITSLMDQPLSRSGILPEEEIPREEFEKAWEKAHLIGQKQPPDFFTSRLNARRKK